ncbi:hypothetical protein [Cohnella sp.]|uniref:hypothetical protein n=1 Tax=Cohnella sp. TaxID=1883426 RepID=UPI003567A97E
MAIGQSPKSLVQTASYICPRYWIVSTERSWASPWTTTAFRECLAKRDAIQRMSGTGRCYDNARMESFSATLKKEKLYKINNERYPMTYIRSIIFRYIMVYYNRR